MSEDPFDTAQGLTSSALLNALSHPCANIFTNLAVNILPDICCHHIKSQRPDIEDSEMLQEVADRYSGVVTPWTYWGTAGTPFPDHQEDGDLNSANFLVAGHPKVWIFRNASQTQDLHKEFKG